jgi:two-component system, chemotaxis family, CheB/CheR fusion protein
MAKHMESGMEAERGAGDPQREFHVVGIGASAGGLAALRTFLRSVPPAPGVAFVVVVHLSPEHESHLPELLQSCTAMPVQHVAQTMPLHPDNVYVIPPNANLSAVDTHLRLSELEEQRHERAPIDHFLRTLARTHDGASVGVILTGAGTDGALGLRQVKENGGLTVAQDPGEAEFHSMPRNAIETGAVDLVLPLREMPETILRFCNTRPLITIADNDDEVAEGEKEHLARILGEVRMRTGHEFSMYRRVALLKRIRRRMQLRHVETLDDYLRQLRSDGEEARALAEDLTLRVTEFFRDSELHERLEQDIFPEIFTRKTSVEDRLRVWSIGCSTGEDAYSLAMLLLEAAEAHEVHPRLKIFASDQSLPMLKRAREGVYPHEIAATVSAERLGRFFDSQPGHYKVRPELSDICVFAEHHLFKDPPYVHLDLIVCRDLFSDLQPEMRRGLLELFHYALEPDGKLILGRQDEINEPQLFVAVNEDIRLFERTRTPRRPPQLPAAMRARQSGMHAAPRGTAHAHSGLDIAVVHRRALEPHTPASVLVAADNRVVHYSATAGRYVQLPGGNLTHDVLQLVQPPLRGELQTALERVRREMKPWESKQLHLQLAGGARKLVLRVEPVAEAPAFLLIVFDERGPRGPAEPFIAEPARTIVSLKRELERADVRLRALLKDQNDDQAALTFANEDLHSAYEELRYILEDLASSREELQAVNEELTTLDEENRVRLRELSELSADLQHLLESTGVATLFLDRELRIVRFTEQLGQLVNIRPTDRGRPFADLNHTLHYDDLLEDARGVLETLEPVDREVSSLAGRWYLARMLPYRTTNRIVEGVVLSLIDITERKRAEDALREADRRKDEFLALLAHELRNPLAPITSGLEVLRMAPGDVDIVEQITATMTRQTQQLVHLVDDLLEVSRVSGGRLRLRKSRVLLADIFRDAAASVRPLTERSGHELTVEVPEEPIELEADAVRLTQVLTNLLNNSVKFTPRGGRISLSARREGDQAVVAVTDDGIGLSEETLRHVFDMFYQADAPEAPRRGGLGIGLTLARSLVEMHGGTLTAESAGPNSGSRFTVRLPLGRALRVPEPPAEQFADPAARGSRVLIVDDNRDAAETLAMELRTLGLSQVQTVFSGQDALQNAAEHHPDIVLLDLKMPHMDGFEVARRMREEPWGKDLFLVSLSGWGQEEHKRQTRDAGFDRHITKPANRAALEAVLAEAPDRLSANL